MADSKPIVDITPEQLHETTKTYLKRIMQLKAQDIITKMERGQVADFKTLMLETIVYALTGTLPAPLIADICESTNLFTLPKEPVDGANFVGEDNGVTYYVKMRRGMHRRKRHAKEKHLEANRKIKI